MLYEAIGRLCPPRICVFEMFDCFIVDGLMSLDIHEEFLGVHGNACSECGCDQGCGPEQFHELCGGEYRSEVLWVYCLISVTSLIKVDVPSSS